MLFTRRISRLMLHSVIPRHFRHVVAGRTHYSRKRSFLSLGDYGEKGRSRSSRENRRWRATTPREVDDNNNEGAFEVEEAFGVEGQDEGGGGVNKDEGGRVTEVYEGRSELRDPPAEGSYYNKFVGGLRSGNNSELRATLRMCLSLLLFKWKWKATSCNGCDLYLRVFLLLSLFLSLIPTSHGISSVFTRRSVSFEFLRRTPVLFPK